jgi:hypothetical protein
MHNKKRRTGTCVTMSWLPELPRSWLPYFFLTGSVLGMLSVFSLLLRIKLRQDTDEIIKAAMDRIPTTDENKAKAD